MKNTIKEFAASCTPEVAALVRPVINQIGLGWRDAQKTIKDAANYGAITGHCGFIYYAETVDFYRKNRKKILALCNYYAEELGEGGAVELVQNFNCIKRDFTADEVGRALYGRYNDDLTQIYNALAWFALEEVGRAYVNYIND